MLEGMSGHNPSVPSPEPSDHDSVSSRPVRSYSRRRALRWLVPAGAAGVVAVLASGVLSANANPNLAPQTATQLLASLATAEPPGFSGTVVEKSSLGLPELPSIAGSNSSSGMLALVSGSHTARVWYGGETKQRIALLDSLGEQDVFRNGRDLWQWDSNTKTATHTVLPAIATRPSPTQLPSLTPADAAARALALIDPTTQVSTDRTEMVAGRAAYTLVLSPKDARTTIGSVRISLDGQTKLPLSVQVIARGADHAAIDVSFTQVSFEQPDDDYFTFKPAAGVTVKPAAPSSPRSDARPETGTSVSTIGKGWTTVAKLTGVPALSSLAKDSGQLSPLLASLPAVSGSWGKGHLFTSALVTGLITDDGRAYVGLVAPDVLYQAAARK